MKIFISGLGGFLGSHLADALLLLGHEIVGCDTFIGGDERNVSRDATCYQQDCRDPTLDLHGVDVVVHCAAIACEGLSTFSPSLISDNIFGCSVALFSNAIASGVRRIVFTSSMARYGVGVPPFKETDRLRPTDPYAISKVGAEHVLRALCKTHRVEHVVAVPHSIYGPRQRMCDPYRNVLAIWINRLMQGKAPAIYGSGEQRRCFSYVGDCIPSLVQMVTRDDMNGETINIGPDEETVSINEACRIVCKAMGQENTIPIYYPSRPAEVHNAYCSSDKARNFLDYKTETSFQEGIEKMVEWAQSIGPQPFRYHLPVEIQNDLTPRTWTQRLL